MKVDFPLKKLRTSPREYIRLLNLGYVVEITEHRKPVARAMQPKRTSRGNAGQILQVIASLPQIETPFKDESTVSLLKRSKQEYLEQKYRSRQ